MLVAGKSRKYNLGPSYIEQEELTQTGYSHTLTKKNKIKMKTLAKPIGPKRPIFENENISYAKWPKSAITSAHKY